MLRRCSIRSVRHLLGFAILVLIWGSTWAAIRVSVHHMPVFRSVALRFDIAAVPLIAAWVWKRPRLPIGPEWQRLFLFSVITFVLPFSLVAWASHHTSSSVTSILFAVTPLLVALFEIRFGEPGRHHLLPSIVAGLIGGLLGITLLLYGSTVHARLHTGSIIAVLFVVALGSLSSVLAKEKLEAIPPLTTATVLTVFAGILLSVVSLLVNRGDQTNWDKQTVWATLFLGVASSALGYFLYYWLLQHMQPYQLAARYFLMPMVALTEGKFMLGEEITAPMLGGMLLILCSIFLVLRERPIASRRQPVMKAEESVSLIG